ncbi:HNH endonuclease family protein [Ruania halotolerans]|uniref:HNH endonuclease family protein n=1 Tax=Ruania halotolerans TaxID=2897773 RepID=UPI001E2ABE47|nr:HNH endonuclease family protein [Ruania halotolerans]UFU06852.1 HNH endonuclease family protein [Ruania halotolerans]
MAQPEVRGRHLVTVTTIAVLVALVLLVLPRWWSQVAPAPRVPVSGASLRAAEAALPRLSVVEPLPLDDYDRRFFGEPWADVDGNGCDTRNDVLGWWLTDQVRDATVSCVVESGVLHDPYTGHVIDFRRGPSTSAAVQIDHVVALADAWRKGAHRWTAQQALQFANDPANLIPADGAANQTKGADDAASWLPPNAGFHCAYVVQQILVKSSYDLAVSSIELEALSGVLVGVCAEHRDSPEQPGTDRGSTIVGVAGPSLGMRCQCGRLASAQDLDIWSAADQNATTRGSRVHHRRRTRVQRERPRHGVHV